MGLLVHTLLEMSCCPVLIENIFNLIIINCNLCCYFQRNMKYADKLQDATQNVPAVLKISYSYAQIQMKLRKRKFKLNKQH